FFFQAEDGIRDFHVTGVQTCALPIFGGGRRGRHFGLGRSSGCSRSLRGFLGFRRLGGLFRRFGGGGARGDRRDQRADLDGVALRSEERRVGNEWRSRRRPAELKTRQT